MRTDNYYLTTNNFISPETDWPSYRVIYVKQLQLKQARLTCHTAAAVCSST